MSIVNVIPVLTEFYTSHGLGEVGRIRVWAKTREGQIFWIDKGFKSKKGKVEYYTTTKICEVKPVTDTTTDGIDLTASYAEVRMLEWEDLPELDLIAGTLVDIYRDEQGIYDLLRNKQSVG